ncbi:MAG: hypothetical protein KGJ86_00060 [Chloroflexota bacterium]|nr:hypothetical protein [Chloroflexota bacterium]
MNLSLPNTQDALAEAEAILSGKQPEPAFTEVEDHGPYFEKWGHCAGANQVIRYQVPNPKHHGNTL